MIRARNIKSGVSRFVYMKYSKILLLFMILPQISATSSHKFYVSITQIEFVKQKSSLQIITKVFTDDIENALRKRHKTPIFLDSKKETAETDVYLKQYILQKININVNAKPVQLNYIGKEYETDMVVAYIEVTNVKDLKTVTIENKILMELFPDQKNIIHLKTEKSRRSLILERDNASGKLEFN